MAAAALLMTTLTFKAINDTLGHPMANVCSAGLRGSASSITEQRDDRAASAARVRGRGARRERIREIEKLAGRSSRSSRPYELDQHTLYIGASIGVATGPRDRAHGGKCSSARRPCTVPSKDAGAALLHCYERSCTFRPRNAACSKALRKALQEWRDCTSIISRWSRRTPAS